MIRLFITFNILIFTKWLFIILLLPSTFYTKVLRSTKDNTSFGSKQPLILRCKLKNDECNLIVDNWNFQPFFISQILPLVFKLVFRHYVNLHNKPWFNVITIYCLPMSHQNIKQYFKHRSAFLEYLTQLTWNFLIVSVKFF